MRYRGKKMLDWWIVGLLDWWILDAGCWMDLWICGLMDFWGGKFGMPWKRP
jgi:hypothetical protein